MRDAYERDAYDFISESYDAIRDLYDFMSDYNDVYVMHMVS